MAHEFAAIIAVSNSWEANVIAQDDIGNVFIGDGEQLFSGKLSGESDALVVTATKVAVKTDNGIEYSVEQFAPSTAWYQSCKKDGEVVFDKVQLTRGSLRSSVAGGKTVGFAGLPPFTGTVQTQ